MDILWGSISLLVLIAAASVMLNTFYEKCVYGTLRKTLLCRRFEDEPAQDDDEIRLRLGELLKFHFSDVDIGRYEAIIGKESPTSKSFVATATIYKHLIASSILHDIATDTTTAPMHGTRLGSFLRLAPVDKKELEECYRRQSAQLRALDALWSEEAPVPDYDVSLRPYFRVEVHAAEPPLRASFPRSRGTRNYKFASR